MIKRIDVRGIEDGRSTSLCCLAAISIADLPPKRAIADPGGSGSSI
jgi:hypothetical protein